MKLHRFYTQEILTGKKEFSLVDKDLIHQLKDVFRFSKGDRVIFFDATGVEYVSVIDTLTKKEVEFSVESFEQKKDIVSRKVHLFLSIIKKDNLELAVEKATELGVASITPVFSERSQYKNVRMDRLSKSIKEATEQGGRVTLPVLHEMKTFSEVLEEYPDVLVLHMEGKDISDVNLSDEVKILIGPEGGWGEKELEILDEKKISTISLPFNTLRAETAVMAGVVLLGVFSSR
jgi:16S rRNA (uracil1498-N3)-methyltransferase